MRLNLSRNSLLLFISLCTASSLLQYGQYNYAYAASDAAVLENLYDFNISTGEKLSDSYKAQVCNNESTVNIEFKVKEGVNVENYIVTGSDNSIIGSISSSAPYMISADLKDGENIIRIVDKSNNQEVYKFDIMYKNIGIKGLENGIKAGETYKLTAVVDNKDYTNVKWKSDDSGTIVINDDGTMTAVKSGIASVSALLYADDNKEVIGSLQSRFNVSGEEKSGWVENGDTWYYVDKDTKLLKTGWLSLDNDWYYLDENGALVTGWISLDDNWYYLKPTGNLAIGWFKDDDSWYYAEEDGKLKTGWFKDHGNWYYFNENGKMQTSSEVINGTLYNFNKHGELELG